MTQTTALDRLPAAESALIGAIQSAASTLDEIATRGLDAALAKLEAAARACHGRLGAAMGTLAKTVSEVVATMEGLAESIYCDLSTEDYVKRAGIDPDTLQPIATSKPADPAPIEEPAHPGAEAVARFFAAKPFAAEASAQFAAGVAPAVVQVQAVVDPQLAPLVIQPVAGEGTDDAACDLREPVETVPAINWLPLPPPGYLQAQQTAKQLHQGEQTVETARPLPSEPTRSPDASQATETAPAVSTMAACSPIEESRDDRTLPVPPAPKPRRRRKSA
jgi:hypothetical protein